MSFFSSKLWFCYFHSKKRKYVTQQIWMNRYFISKLSPSRKTEVVSVSQNTTPKYILSAQLYSKQEA